MSAQDNPYWSESEQRIVLPRLTQDGFIIHSQKSKEHLSVLRDMGVRPDADIFHEDTLIYLREREKNRKVAKDLEWIVGPNEFNKKLDLVGINAVYGARTFRKGKRLAISKGPKMFDKTWELSTQFGAAGYASGGFAGARAGALAGFGTGLLLSAAEIGISFAEVLGIKRPKGIGLDWEPPKELNPKKKKSRNTMDVPDIPDVD